MAQNRLQLPSGQGGLVRYFDDYKSKIELRPDHVIWFIVAVIVLEILLNILG